MRKKSNTYAGGYGYLSLQVMVLQTITRKDVNFHGRRNIILGWPINVSLLGMLSAVNRRNLCMHAEEDKSADVTHMHTNPKLKKI